MTRYSNFVFAIFFFPGIHSINGQGFVDVAPDAGMDYTFGNVDYGGGVSFADFNQDGLDDLTFTSGFSSQLHFHQNTGSGFIEIASPINNTTETKQPIWVDYDNDGDLDLWVSSYDVNRLYRNDGNLVMTDVTLSSGFNDPIAPSFNGSWLDYDEDGYLDLITAHRISHLVGHVSLYHNLGNGTFENTTDDAGLTGLGNSVLAIATLDMNNDGWEDIFVGQDFQAGCLMLKNNGNGTFDNISVASNSNIESNTMTVTIGDYNNDGYMDVFLTDTGGDGCSLLENQGDETFMDVATIKGVLINQFLWGASFFDADNDMDLDLHIGGRTGSPFASQMFENISGGLNFVNANVSWGFGMDNDMSIGNAIGDFNEDGYPDLAKNNTNGSVNSLWRNDFSENNYLSVHLVGVISNSMAVGAVVHVYSGGVHQMRRVGCGEGFSSQHSYTQFFGLASNEVVDSIVVNWPNGVITSAFNIPANQQFEMIEDNAGCTDPLACNYNANALTDNGSCTYPEPFYDCVGNCTDVDTDGDGICDVFEIPGCTDVWASNYSPDATDDDASCIYTCFYRALTLITDCWGGETSWNITNDLGEIVMSAPGNTYGSQQTFISESCLDPGCYTFNIFDSYGDGLAGMETGCGTNGNYFMSDSEGNIQFEMENANFGFGTMHFFCIGLAGCSDPLACNYDPNVSEDDGSCLFPEPMYDCYGFCINDADGDLVCDEFEIAGCTDPDACNFDPLATDNNGDCTYMSEFEISGELFPVINVPYNYSYPSSAGSNYYWIVLNGNILSGNGTPEVSVEWLSAGSNSLGVVESGEWCEGDIVWLDVDVLETSITGWDLLDLSVFPNPAHDILTVRSNREIQRLRVLDISGSEVIRQEIAALNEGHLNVHSLSDGMYYVEVLSSHGTAVLPFVHTSE